MTADRTEWRWGCLAAAAIVLVTILPQVLFVIDRGSAWNGANAAMHPDEVAYSDYVASIIRGRPRRNDPFTGRTDHSDWVVPESLFSIQAVPPYLVALPARWLGVSSSTVFIVGPIVFAAASSLALFWLFLLMTRNPRLSAAAVCFVLCFGTLIARQGIVRYVPNLTFLIPMWLSEMVLPASAYHLPFLRFYQPAVAFPLFFVLCAFVWRALSEIDEHKALLFGVGAGTTFVLLIFSYFYLWTAAAAFLTSVAAFWILIRAGDRRRTVITFGIILAFALPAFFVYFRLLSKRADTVDSVQALVLTHQPDLFRVSEITVFVAFALLLIAAVRRNVAWRAPVLLFTVALGITVVATFNQQILTGRSLQPIHYEWFIGNYCALATVVLTAHLVSNGSGSKWWSNRKLLTLAIVSLLWGACEVWLAARINLDLNRQIDEMRLVGKRLTELGETDGTLEAAESGRPVPAVLVSDLQLADRLPTDAPQAVLWSPRMLVFPGVSDNENRERFFQQLYYLGYDDVEFNQKLDSGGWNFYAGMFPYYRLSPVVSGHGLGITPDEVRAQLKKYFEYSTSFSRERARQRVISYVLLSDKSQPDWHNMDQWYEHDQGEHVGTFMLYRVKLKP